MERSFKRWVIQEKDLEGLTPLKARDLIIRCFFEAQKETLARVKQTLGRETSDEEIQKSVVNLIKLTFKEVGGSYENPTKKGLGNLVQSLAQKSSAWGTPNDIIEHHKGEITKVLKVLKD